LYQTKSNTSNVCQNQALTLAWCSRDNSNSEIAGNGFENGCEEAAEKAQLFLLRLKPVDFRNILPAKGTVNKFRDLMQFPENELKT